MSISLKKEKTLERESRQDKALNFIAAGVACYAFSLLDELGILEPLLNGKGLTPDFFRAYPNPLVVRTAIQTLECNGIVFLDEKVFKLTSFGDSLAKHRSSIGLIYKGYCKALSDQVKIAQDQPLTDWSLADEKAISKASSHLGEKFFNDKLLAILKKHSINGTICDLGCGDASTLLYLCRKSKLSGLGFDFSSLSIATAKNKLNLNDKIVLVNKDITKITKVYPEVKVLIQSFVMHDFSNSVCKKVLKSLRKCFPNAKLFLYVDAVSPENNNLSQLPGFDYVHSLFGIQPRTFEQTSKLLAESDFHIINQEPISGLTNCYIWTLRLFK